VLILPATHAQQLPTPPPQAQIQSCLAAIPKPKPPSPPRILFPALQAKIDQAIRKAGGDPNAMRQAAAEAAQIKYQDAMAEYQRKSQACYLPVSAETPKQYSKGAVQNAAPDFIRGVSKWRKTQFSIA
jgi:hypothetical protein